jgi:hypothetical protein
MGKKAILFVMTDDTCVVAEPAEMLRDKGLWCGSCSEGFAVQIDSIKHLSARQKTGIHGVIPYGEFLYLTSAASYPITSDMSTMAYTTR